MPTPKQRTAQQQAAVRMRAHLYEILDNSAIVRDDPQLADILELAVQSTDPEMVPRVFGWVRSQMPVVPREEPDDRQLFREPDAQELEGDVYVGDTVPSGRSVKLPLECFGQNGHTLLAGMTGYGKSTLLNLMAVQLIQRGVPVVVYDTLDQAWQVLIPQVTPEKLAVLDISDYRRNLFVGPTGMSQLDWISNASDHFIEAFLLEPVTFNTLLQMCKEIVDDGELITVPRVVDRLQDGKHRDQSHMALRRRFLPLTYKAAGVFTCERGFDLDQLLSGSLVLNLKNAGSRLRRIIYSDHYAYLSLARKQLPRWALKLVFMYHEGGKVISQKAVNASEDGDGDSLFLKMIREARNYGIGLVFADQVPQAEHDIVRANIGTKCIFRLGDDSSVDVFRNTMKLDERQRNAILNLPKRSVVVSLPGVPYPFLARVPDVY